MSAFRLTWAAAVLIFWAAMMTILFQDEILPSWRQTGTPSYKSALEKVETPEHEIVMGIWAKNQKIGFTRRRTEKKPEGGYLISNFTEVQFGNLGRLRMKFDTHVDPDFNFEKFESSYVMPGGFQGEMRGVKRGQAPKEKLILTTDTKSPFGKESRTESLDYNPGAMFGSEFNPVLSMPDLAVGKEWDVEMLGGMSQRLPGMRKVRAKVISSDYEPFLGEEYRVYVVRMEMKGIYPMATDVFITTSGVILRTELKSMNMFVLRETPLFEWEKRGSDINPEGNEELRK